MLTAYGMESPSFNELYGGGPAQDRVRGQTIPPVPIKLDTLGASRSHLGPYTID